MIELPVPNIFSLFLKDDPVKKIWQESLKMPLNIITSLNLHPKMTIFIHFKTGWRISGNIRRNIKILSGTSSFHSQTEVECWKLGKSQSGRFPGWRLLLLVHPEKEESQPAQQLSGKSGRPLLRRRKNTFYLKEEVHRQHGRRIGNLVQHISNFCSFSTTYQNPKARQNITSLNDSETCCLGWDVPRSSKVDPQRKTIRRKLESA